MKDAQGREVIIFHLKRFWEGQIGSMYIKSLDLYEEIKAGRKTSEWRDDTEFWRKRLLNHPYLWAGTPKLLIPMRAWFVCGYPKGNIPRLEADIRAILHRPETEQIEVMFRDVVEEKAN